MIGEGGLEGVPTDSTLFASQREFRMTSALFEVMFSGILFRPTAKQKMEPILNDAKLRFYQSSDVVEGERGSGVTLSNSIKFRPSSLGFCPRSRSKFTAISACFVV